MAKYTRLLTPIALSATLLIGLAQFGAAKTSSQPNESQIAATAANTAPSKDKAATTGTTTDLAVDAAALKKEEQQLRQMGEAIKRTKRASMDLIGECTQPIEMMGEIDIIGQDVIPIMPATAEGFGTQYNPPRPKYIKFHMTQLAGCIPILQDDIDTLVIPDSEKEVAQQPLQDLKGLMNDLQMHYKKLSELTKTDGDYNQLQITSEARGIDACCKDIDVARKKLLHEDLKQEREDAKLQRQQSKK